MCGVFALFYRRPLTDDDIEFGRRGTEAIAYRGPDASGEWADRGKGIFLGHRRLSIIDLSHDSDQPMLRGSLALSYNGEIYNYRSLRDRLTGLGQAFQTSGDTEVLLAAWSQWGQDALKHIDGMFGFALWDGKSGWLALDRFGEKRLYVAETDDGLVVCSELAPLARLLSLKPELDQAQIAAYMSLGYLPAPRTAYPTIQHVMPATIVRISNGRIASTCEYWRPPIGEPGRGPIRELSSGEIDRLQKSFIGSVESRLESDAPTCLFLSAGIDSSLIAAVAARELERKLKCFTISFLVGEIHNEATAAAETASFLSLPHETLESQDDPTDVSADFFFDLHGQPCDDVVVASLHQMSIAAARDHKVALTGVGGDEIIFGYNKHVHFFRLRHFYNLPQAIRRVAGMLLRPGAPHWSKIATFCDLIAVRDEERYIAQKNYPVLPALRTMSGFSNWAAETFKDCAAGIEIEVPVFELNNVLPNHRLVSGDLGSMRASLETRTPFLDPALLETIATFDPRSLLKYGQKTALRRVLRRYLPEHMTRRPKLGFVFPVDRFLQHFDCPQVDNGLPEALTKKVWQNRHQRGWKSLAVRLTMLSEFQRWSAKEVD